MRVIVGILVSLLLVSIGPLPADARYAPKHKHDMGPGRVLVQDGSSVHNVGELQMHLLNWGEWGSRPGTGLPYSFAPSAQWPAGSGIEYLFSAGLWVGALKGGVPAVSTATFEHEFRPSQDPRDIVYRASEGVKNGRRAPFAGADDDEDGLVDEDYLDGYDNDGDGRVDEDFAAISRQMLTCRYTDDQPVSEQINPQHNPLGILVNQESYQWDSDRFDDFVGVEFRITNIGDQFLEDVYIGMFVDGDAGPVDRDNYWEDDLVGRTHIPILCTDLGPRRVDLAYTYDADGDGGETLGRFGVMFLGHSTDPAGQYAPTSVGIKSFAHFAGRQSFVAGGDPTNDFERYELLSQATIEADAREPRDYRMLVSTGPFRELDPDSTIVLQMAFVIGAGEFEPIDNATNAQFAFDGVWLDIDGDRMTGIDGRETPRIGPLLSVYVDSCRLDRGLEQGCDFEARRDPRFNDPIRHLVEGDTIWSNADCELECTYRYNCGYGIEDSLLFRTGVAGKETQVRWIVIGSPPPPPGMRIDDHAREGVVVYWDNFSETVPDMLTRRLDFEGYQVWRADNWTRPAGTSVNNGPPTDLWTAIYQGDRINNFGSDSGLDALRYEPLTHLFTPQEKRVLIGAIKEHLIEFPGREPPCPQGVTAEVCDTLKGLARRELGIAGGKQYYRYVDRDVILGMPYFYSVVAFDNEVSMSTRFPNTQSGDPASNFVFVEPKSAAQAPYAYNPGEIYVVPNPVREDFMAPWALGPTNEDPTGLKMEFRNLPRARGIIRIYTLAADLVEELPFDATTGIGTVRWDLVSRNGQDVTSGVYLYSIEFEDKAFDRVIKKFTVIR